MLRGNTKKQFTHYPLMGLLVTGVLGAYSTIENIGYGKEIHTDQKLAYLTPPAKSNKATAVKTSNSIKTLDEKKAFNLVWNLPQVQRKAREIASLSRGSIKLAAVVESSPTTDTPFYVVSVFENHPDKTTSPVYWFRVSSSSGVVEPLDLVQNQYIALEKWNPDGR
ncbi:hypothetical protein H6G54_16235 [Anabaena cylindrica FACHB-243]|uniref:Uncharacterized protein n=1 Tax=Anabaena cylindrica (strain ATCC 27899 / PCC 7122) TaxID=272123 RepID=K9ZKM5_ANACC|nr:MULTISPECIES: hypothetical protein [Anabaena]AFZ59112.1 hypothetical protein Anacy_3728 [Anabaena cylindrica PCC 7122]MBD2419218.1 hypothetical protein [Anabaena cylindrica FACHB-243]MBY5283549.1 hypothetical protein [Anabaena sp. CCAP 1446/1C]MBY5308905.1 hypothetical protein [Anabaena sp. CCAP 1446/1C]MCM2409899.1 hypothetical protein [Anabaena sp. CCAP 1446/1C]